MPRNVRNFWIELQVDGKKVPIATGPRGKDGGFVCTIRMRDNGQVTKPLTVVGRVMENGTLVLDLDGEDTNGVYWSKCAKKAIR